MNEEKYIQDRVGKRNPFRVPDGYFDTFADQLLQQLPERNPVLQPEPQSESQPVLRPESQPVLRPRAKSIWLRPFFYAAASICVLLICGAAWFFSQSDPAAPSPSVQAQTVVLPQESSDLDLDEAADYMMLDNQQIYTYLADN